MEQNLKTDGRPTPKKNPKTDAPEAKESRDKPKIKFGQWWRAKEQGRKPHEILDTVVRGIVDDQQGRYEAYREYERLFGASVGPNSDDSFRAIASDDLTQNELQNTIETLWAQVFKNKVLPAVSVSEADWEEWDRAKGYSRWLHGAFDEAKIYEHCFPRAGAYSLVHGTGFIKVYWGETDGDSACVKACPVNPRYLYVDRLEAKHGSPRNLYQKDHIDRNQLFETYSEDSKEYYGDSEDRKRGINDCTPNDDIEIGTVTTDRCDMLTVWESWHLPSGPKAKDGRHCIWIKGCTLVDEEFTWDTFPFVIIRFGVPMEGWYGESAVKRLAPTQKRLDELNVKLQQSQQVMGVPRVIVRRGANIVLTHLDDIPGGILEADDLNGIKEWDAQCASPELYQERDNCPHKMRGLLGISDFEAQQQIPQGMRDVSGAFLERWVDQGQARHAMFHAEYENAVVQLAYLFARQAEDLQEMGYSVVVKAPSGSHRKTAIDNLSFKDVQIDRKRLKLTVQPMSQLPQTFSGKVEAIEKMKQAQLPLDPKAAMRMLEVPDVNGASDELVSSEEIIFKNLSYMCKTGTYLAPMPFDNLDLIVRMTTDYINMYRVREDSDNQVVGLLAQYIDDAIQLKKGLGASNPSAPPSVAQALGFGGQMPGQPPMPGMQPGMPQAGPMAPGGAGMPSPMAGPMQPGPGPLPLPPPV